MTHTPQPRISNASIDFPAGKALAASVSALSLDYKRLLIQMKTIGIAPLDNAPLLSSPFKPEHAPTHAWGIVQDYMGNDCLQLAAYIQTDPKHPPSIGEPFRLDTLPRDAEAANIKLLGLLSFETSLAQTPLCAFDALRDSINTAPKGRKREDALATLGRIETGITQVASDLSAVKNHLLHANDQLKQAAQGSGRGVA